jgi:hypothetical protein
MLRSEYTVYILSTWIDWCVPTFDLHQKAEVIDVYLEKGYRQFQKKLLYNS